MTEEFGAFVPGMNLNIPGAKTGPLTGLTFTAKDVFDIEGLVSGNGNPTWRATHAPAAATAPVITALLDAGAHLHGRTICDELCYSLTGTNRHDGTPVNPRTPDRLAGGSSCGSVVAVAGGLVDFAPATDCGGSVRVPASLCGIYGIRPTFGRVSANGVVPLSLSFDTVGWFARDAATFRKVGAVMLDRYAPPAAAGRLLVAEDMFAVLPDGLSGAIRAFVAVAEAATGLTAEPVDLAENQLADWMEAFRVLQAEEIWRNNGAWVTEHRPDLDPGIAARLEFAASVKSSDVAAQTPVRTAASARLEALLGDDAIICLPSSGLAPLRDAEPTELEAYRAHTLSLTCPAGLAGTPQIHVPLGKHEGCPIGLSLMAWRGGDEMLLETALNFES